MDQDSNPLPFATPLKATQLQEHNDRLLENLEMMSVQRLFSAAHHFGPEHVTPQKTLLAPSAAIGMGNKYLLPRPDYGPDSTLFDYGDHEPSFGPKAHQSPEFSKSKALFHHGEDHTTPKIARVWHHRVSAAQVQQVSNQPRFAVLEGEEDPEPPHEQNTDFCNCKNSKCLKLYCHCFRAGRYCTDQCLCVGCRNKLSHDQERSRAMEAIKTRNPMAFRPRVDHTDADVAGNENDELPKLAHYKGCNCKKSGCQKKYCECYQLGVECTDLCKCCDCKNGKPNQDDLLEPPPPQAMSVKVDWKKHECSPKEASKTPQQVRKSKREVKPPSFLFETSKTAHKDSNLEDRMLKKRADLPELNISFDRNPTRVPSGALQDRTNRTLQYPPSNLKPKPLKRLQSESTLPAH